MLMKSTLFIVAVLLIFLVLGCSSTGQNPATPQNQISELLLGRDVNSEHSLWGIWDIHFDLQGLTAEIEPKRNVMGHFNITDMILPPACLDCLDINVISFDPITRILDAFITLKNPSAITARDVRGILFTNEFGHELTNPDSWTGLYDPPGGDIINPFKAFASSEPMRMFAGGASHVENYIMLMPTPAQFAKITFAVDVSWPGNCKEPYVIGGGAVGDLPPSDCCGEIFTVGIADWQNDVVSARLTSGELFGTVVYGLHEVAVQLWQTDTPIFNLENAPPGTYKALVTATSATGIPAELYQYVDIVVVP